MKSAATLFDDTELFSSGELRRQNFDIPDAELTLWEHFFNRNEADQFYKQLLEETPWKQEEITVYDKTHLTPRMTVMVWQTPAMQESRYTIDTRARNDQSKSGSTDRHRIHQCIGKSVQGW